MDTDKHRLGKSGGGEGAEEAGGGGESKVGKKQGRKTMQLGKCVPLHRVSG